MDEGAMAVTILEIGVVGGAATDGKNDIDICIGHGAGGTTTVNPPIVGVDSASPIK